LHRISLTKSKEEEDEEKKRKKKKEKRKKKEVDLQDSLSYEIDFHCGKKIK
jgi:hypothetical protein